VTDLAFEHENFVPAGIQSLVLHVCRQLASFRRQQKHLQNVTNARNLRIISDRQTKCCAEKNIIAFARWSHMLLHATAATLNVHLRFASYSVCYYFTCACIHFIFLTQIR